MLAERDPIGADRLARDGREHLLGHRHQLLVVAVGLVELEHRELGVVLRRDPLVPEVAVDLVDALDAADGQPLQVQLRRDAQEQLHVERVVVRHERPRERAAGDRLHHRRLDLEVAARVQERADRRQHPAAHLEDLARVRVDDEIEIALAVAHLDVAQAVPLLGQREEALGRGTRARRPRSSARWSWSGTGCPRTPMKSPKSSSLKIAKSRSRERVLADVDLDARPAVRRSRGSSPCRSCGSPAPVRPSSSRPARPRAPRGLALVRWTSSSTVSVRSNACGYASTPSRTSSSKFARRCRSRSDS